MIAEGFIDYAGFYICLISREYISAEESTVRKAFSGKEGLK
jgi:hypothetical protein